MMSLRFMAFRWSIRLLGLLLLLCLLGLAGAWWLLAGSEPLREGAMRLRGLSRVVVVQRDASGVATIDAHSRDDLSYALGFVQAQEHFFGMDLMRRSAAGELAELVGPAAFPLDLAHRQHQLREVARAAYARLSPTEQKSLQHYVDGVNEGLTALRSRPWEYLLLRSQPRRWRAEDSLLAIAAMYLDLNGNGDNERELRVAQMRASLPGPLVDFLLAPDPDWEAPLLGDLSRPPLVPDANVIDLRPRPASAVAAATAADSVATWSKTLVDEQRPGSNSFAVSGALTGSGAAILANDMHLGLSVPNIWYRARLRYDDPSAPGGRRELNGLTLPGTPAMVAGSNGQIAWGFTNSYGDWMDWVRVRLDPRDPNRYQTPDGWQPLKLVHETIRARGGESRQLGIRETRWGPILAEDTDGTPLALAWIGDLPRAYNLHLLDLERAANTRAALDIAPTLGIPPQNLLVADSGGHIGWTLAGNSVPRRAGFDPGKPADWSQPGVGWIGWTAPTAYPRLLDPADGRLWTANNRTVAGEALNLLGEGGHDLGARAQQIRDDLRARQHFEPADLLDIQLDDHAVFLTRWQQLLQETLDKSPEPELEPLRQLTASWRGVAAPDSVDYRLVRAFRLEVQKAVLAPFVARVTHRYGDFEWPPLSNPEAAVWILLRERPAWLLDPAYASWDALLLASARRAIAPLQVQPGGLQERRWGEANRADIDPPLARALPGFIRYFLDMPHDELAGDRDMPRVAAPAFGASERLDVMPGHEARSILHMPAGQSDNPLAPYYGAGHEAWVQGRPTPLLPGPSRYTLTLHPGGG